MSFSQIRLLAPSGGRVGSPFQTEIGVCNLALGATGLLCIRYRGEFWAATIVMASVFWAGAGFVHIASIIREHNFAPNNTYILVSNFIIPLTLLGLSRQLRLFRLTP